MCEFCGCSFLLLTLPPTVPPPQPPSLKILLFVFIRVRFVPYHPGSCRILPASLFLGGRDIGLSHIIREKHKRREATFECRVNRRHLL